MDVPVRISLLALAASIALAACCDSHAQATDRCVGLEAITLKPRGDLPLSVIKRIQRLAISMQQQPLPASVSCGSISKAIDRLVNGKPIGGKRLENDAPFDTAAAQAELDQAIQQEAGLSDELAQVQVAAADIDARLLLEAAVLHDRGVFKARDLRLQQLLQETGE
jgi:hypothetical protein